MRPAPPETMTRLEEAIWRTVAYVDLFDYPLTAVEIHRYLDGENASVAKVSAALAGQPRLAAHLSFVEGYFCLPGREHLVQVRRARKVRAQQLWPQAISYGRLIAGLPFVRMVAVTGSLAMDNVAGDADIDYFIVTENGRLWLARAFVIAIVRLAQRRGIALCPNYFVAESALTVPEHNLYTARELGQMVPLFGHDVYDRLRHENCWVSQFLPNAAGPPSLKQTSPAPAGWFRKLLERPLQTRLGLWLEKWERARKIPKLRCQQNGSLESNFSATICKGHFEAHQHRTLNAFRHRLHSGQNGPNP